MNLKEIIIFLFISFTITYCNGQDVDTNYVGKYNHKFVLGLYQNYNNHSVYISQNFQNDTLVSSKLHPIAESLINTGVMFATGKFYLGLNLFGFLNDAPKRKPQPRSLNLVFGFNNKNKITEFGLNWFKGYYESNSSNIIPNFNKDSAYYHYNGLRSFNLYINHINFYNKTKFSINAAYKGNALQKKSAYSFLHFFNVNYNNLISSEAIIPQLLRNKYDKFGEMDKLNNFYLCAGMGASGTWVISKEFFTNLTLMMGPGLQFQNYSLATDNKIRSRVNIMLHTDLRFSLGFNLNRFYIVSGTFIKFKTFNMDKMHITSSHIMNNLTIGYRFGFKNKGLNPKTVLKKLHNR